jgi:hypothetical protein
MPHDDADTDPSTPESRGRTEPGPGPAAHGARITPSKIVPVSPVSLGASTDPMPSRPRETGTDPGVAPPSGAFAGKPPRVAVVAPPRSPSKPPVPGSKTPPMPFTAPKANDSIDVLLEGITGTSTRDKPRSTAETRGEASAAYEGAPRELLPAHDTPPPEPLVIVERMKQPPTVKLDRAQLQQMAAHAPPPASVRPVTHGAEPTFVTPRSQGPRVVVALFAAILVAMKSWTTKVKQNAVAADPSASALINGKEPPPKSWTPNATATAATSAATAATTATTATDDPATPAATITTNAAPAIPAPTNATPANVSANANAKPAGKPAPKASNLG